ncbi:MAG: BACON domain-containing protein [Prevotella sp.]|nr:BACON domain-containing protein [Prevotella sp.]
MKRFLIIVLFVFLGLNASAQHCYRHNMDNATKFLRQHNYRKAQASLEAAKECQDKTPHADVEIKEGLDKCKAAYANDNKKPPQKKPSSSNVKKPMASSITLNYRVGCKKGMQGIEVTAIYYVENMRGKKVFAECYAFPKTSNSVSAKYSGTEYNLKGKPGQRGSVNSINNTVEGFSEIFFIPFGAMTLQNYEEQSFEIMLKVYQADNQNQTISGGSSSQTVISAPVSVYVDDDIKDQYLSFPSSGGDHDFAIDVCGDMDWVNNTNWIVSRAGTATIFVDENTSSSPREAVLTIRPRDGGNTVNIHVSQKGAIQPAIAERPLAEIKNVRLQHNFRDQYGRYNTVFHVQLAVRKQKGKRVQVYAQFYNADDETKLLDADGKWITCHGSGNPSSDDAIFDDFKFYIDNLKIQKASNLQEKEVNAHILVTFDGGKTWITQSGPYTISW